MKRYQNTTKGFTLIEVLIASVILFGSISIVSQAFRGAVNSSLKAQRSVEIARTVPMLLNIIEFRLRTQPLNKPIQHEGVFDDATFSWSAKVVNRDGASDRLSPEDGAIIEFDDRFYLWEVNLSVQHQGLQKDYLYKEFTWDNPIE
jgi:type II secretory pathway pseudopilin PulG